MRKLSFPALLCLSAALIFILAGCGGGSHNTTPPPDQNQPAYSNADLNGTYILTATGADFLGTNGIAAQFVADGQGHLTSGALLANTVGNGTKLVDTTFTGTYSVQEDGRGSATFTLAAGNPMKFQFAINASGITVIRFDNDGVAVGAIMKQSSSISAVNGRFVYNLDGWQSASGVTSEQHSVGSLVVSNSEVYTARQLVKVGTLIEDTFIDDEIGSFTLGSNGIGTAVMTGSATSLHLRLYFVSNDKAVVIADQEGTLLAGFAERQTSTGNTGSNSVLNGNYVFLTEGMDYLPVSARWAGIGRMTADGNGNLTGVRDTTGLASNDVNAPFTATYAMIADGHGTITIPDGPQLTIYTVSADKALIVGSGQNTYTWGVMQKQSAGTFSASTVTGKFSVAMGGGPTYVGGIWNANGSGTLTGTVDVYSNGTLSTGQSITGTYQVDSTGRGTGTVAANAIGLGVTPTFYVVSSSEVWTMSTDPARVIGHAFKQ